MIDRLLAFLKDLPGRPALEPDRGDPRIAVAALMIHVMDADGLRLDAEVHQLKEALTAMYGVSGDALDSLLAAGHRAEEEAVDLYSFTSVIMRNLDAEARTQLIGILWEVVYADHERHELEDNLVWRIAELIGVSSRDRTVLRSQMARA